MKVEWAMVGSSRLKAKQWYKKYTKYEDEQIEEFLNLIEHRSPSLEAFDTKGIEYFVSSLKP
jgi:predicted PolB exonuclease-like 3'-5' exonuclease